MNAHPFSRQPKREPEALISPKRWKRMANGHYLARVSGGAYLITRTPYTGRSSWTFEVHYAAEGGQFERIPLTFSSRLYIARECAQDHYDKMTEGK